MNFPHTASIQRMTKTGTKYAYSTVGSTKCFLQPLDAEKAQLYSIVFTKASACYVPFDTEVNEGDRFLVNSNTYTVRGIREHNYGSLRHKYVLLEQQ